MCKIGDLFESMLPVLIEKAKKSIKIGGHEFNAFFEAYNQMQEEEFNGDYYIFNINDKGDLKFLVDNDMMAASDIAFAYQNYEAGLFRYLPDNQIEPLSVEKVKEIIIDNLEPLVRCVLMYSPENCIYGKVYNILIGDALVATDFNSLC